MATSGQSSPIGLFVTASIIDDQHAGRLLYGPSGLTQSLVERRSARLPRLNSIGQQSNR